LNNAAIAARPAALPAIADPLLDRFVRGPMTGKAIQLASMALKTALIERPPGGELSHRLGYYPPGGDQRAEPGNHPDGSTRKAVRTENGPLRIEVPREREGSLQPLLIPAHERRGTDNRAPASSRVSVRVHARTQHSL